MPSAGGRSCGGRWLLSLALGAVALTAGAEELVGGTAPALQGALLLGPLLAGARLGPRATAVVSCGALAAAVVTGVCTLDMPAPDLALRAGVLAVGGALAVQAARCRTAREADLIRVGQVTRRAILRPLSVRLGGVDVATRYCSAAQERDQDALIGGDLFDVANSPYGLRVVVGDVRGHDLDSVCLAAATVSAFRDLAYTTPRLPDLAAQLDVAVAGELGAEDFVTVVLAEFASGEVRLVNCGHPAPLRVNSCLEPLEPAEPAPPLGLHPKPRQQRYRLAEGERLLFYTDGLIEARDPEGRLFPLDGRVRRALAQPVLRDCLDALRALVADHTAGPLADDLALVLCEPVVLPAVPAQRHPADAGRAWPEEDADRC